MSEHELRIIEGEELQEYELLAVRGMGRLVERLIKLCQKKACCSQHVAQAIEAALMQQVARIALAMFETEHGRFPTDEEIAYKSQGLAEVFRHYVHYIKNDVLEAPQMRH